MKRLTSILWLLLLVICLNGQTNVLPNITLMPFASGFNQPVGIEHAGDSRLYVVEQTGKIRIVNSNGKWKSHFLNLSDKVLTTGFEQGLLGLAFHPDYENNGYFYVHYTNLDGNSTISRFNVNPQNPDKALPSSEVILFVNDDPFSNHNSGQIIFGPDGYLYFAIGDGGAGGDPFNNGQDLSTTFGKLMRMEATEDGWAVPASNPYVGMPGVAEEIWASGLRNPWRFSFDALTGDLWIPDVGQNLWEEVNYTPSGMSGMNYGWACREGLHPFKADCDDNGIPFTDPIAEYAHDESGQFLCSGSVTGGFVYRGALYPNMYGKYFYTDFCTGVIRTTYWFGGAWQTAELGNFTPFAYSTFGQDINNELYLVDKTSGTIYRFTDGGGAPLAGITPTEPAQTGYTYGFTENDADTDEVVRQRMHEASMHDAGKANHSVDYDLFPNPNQGQFTLRFTSSANGEGNVVITDIMGHEISGERKDLIKGVNEWKFNTSSLSGGVYYLQIHSADGTSVMKFLVD